MADPVRVVTPTQERRDRALEVVLRRDLRPLVLTTYNRTSCIVTVRLVCELARYAGVLAKPVCVSIGAFNRVGWEQISAGARRPSGEGMSIGVNPGEHSNFMDGGWAGGHLVALLDGTVLVDGSIDQLNRPEFGIELPPCLVHDLDVPFASVGDQVQLEDRRDGTVVVYVRTVPPKGHHWTDQPNWRRGRDWKPLIAELVRRFNREVDR